MSASARILMQAGVVAGLLAMAGSCGGGGNDASTTGGVAAVAPPAPSPPAPPPPPPPPPPPTTSSPAPETVGDYKLVWQDDFNGSVISTKCWDYVWTPQNNPDWELQAFVNSPENSFVKDGMLNIVALKKNVTVNGKAVNYTSAELMTLGRQSWTYGRFEARIKIPKGNGLWPIFWMIPQDGVYGGWPNSGEIDIAEFIGATPTQTYQSIHGPGTDTTLIADAGKPLGDDFHVFALEWSPTGMKYFVDGVQTNEIAKWNQPPGAAFPAPFDQKFFIFLNLSIGSVWGGPPNAQTVFPATMLVDYVRVYQKGASTASAFRCS